MPTPAEAHQDRLLARADQSADQAERAVRKVWLRLLDVIRTGGPHYLIQARVRTALNALPQIASEVLDDLARTARDAAAWTAVDLAQRLPRAHREHILRTRKPLLEHEHFDELERLLLPSLPESDIHRVVYAAGWVDRVQALTRLAEPDVLAARIANAVQAGLSVAQIARDIRPLLQGVQTSARRVARTAGLWIAHEAELHTYEQLPDVIEGYAVNAVLDHATRPLHRKRDGWKYYREPVAGQRGFDVMPRPPRESDGSWAFNCRCWLEPLLRAL